MEEVEEEVRDTGDASEEAAGKMGPLGALVGALAGDEEELATEAEAAAAALREQVDATLDMARATATAALDMAGGLDASGTMTAGVEVDVPDEVALPTLPELDDLRLGTIGAVETAIGGFQDALDQVSTARARGQIQAAMGHLKEMRVQMMLSQGKAIDLGGALEQGLASAIANVAAAIGSGENVAMALMETLTTLAMRVGKMLIAFGTASLNLRTLITNPVTAILAGAALLALAAAARTAIRSEIEQTTGAGGGGQTPRGGAGSSFGGTPGPPSFAEGVTDFEGGAALVGEEGPELVTMGRGSNVITNENTVRITETVRQSERLLAASAGNLAPRRPGGGEQGVQINETSVERISQRLEEAVREGRRAPRKLHLTGEFRQRGRDMVLVIDEVRTLQEG